LRKAAPVCLALVLGALIGVTIAKRDVRLDPFGSLRMLDYGEPEAYYDMLVGRK
jgi:hypothetical protein